MAVTLHTTLGDMKIENIKGFMIQGGDPTNLGKGGESIWGSPFNDEFHSEHKHDKRGTLSMAHSRPNQNSSQFFIAYGAQPHLNNQYTIFGQVIDGFEVLDMMEKAPVGTKNMPLVDISIDSVTIHANPLA